MITKQTLKVAQDAAEELRQRGETERAAAIEALVEAARDGRTALPTPQIDAQIGDLVGASGREIKAWVQEGRYSAYRAGRLMIPKGIMEEYVRRAGDSIDLEDFSDEEAARLVAEGRHD